MIVMNEMPCCYCKHFKATKEEKIRNHSYVVGGKCIKFQKEVDANGIVCKDFLLMSGVVTSRKVPDYCVNKNWIELGNGRIKVYNENDFD